jgi:LPS sulfotransferase NodH
LAKSSGVWHNKGIASADKVSLDINRLDKSLKFFERCDKELREFNSENDILELDYESMAENIPETLSRVFDFLGVDQHFKPEMELRKTSDFLFKDRIVNYKEVKALLSSRGKVLN